MEERLSALENKMSQIIDEKISTRLRRMESTLDILTEKIEPEAIVETLINSSILLQNGHIENTFSNLTAQIQSVQDNLGPIENTFSNLTAQIQSVQDNLGPIENTFSNLTTQIQTVQDNLGPIENTFSNLTTQIQTVQDNLGPIENTFSNLTAQIQSVQDNLGPIENTFSNLTTQIQTVQNNLGPIDTKINNNVKTQVETMLTNQLIVMRNLNKIVCPDGYFKIPASDACFKIFLDKKRSWYEVNEKCQAEGMTMAKPDDPVTARNYLNTRYGEQSDVGWPYVWLPARGTGSTVNWQDNGGEISSDSPLWTYEHPGGMTSSSYCLLLITDDDYRKAHPLHQSPYYMQTCTTTDYALCERVIE
ncbi:unnamed protein product [Meganyctiphanes norvegica]|uniref:C-type lectin domain-containing protein n=1 Tax=Meganyctiphanes norvegica TaxID=48144 RepID=A0AAV2PV97_MEGNR